MESLCILLSCIITPASRSVISISFFACSVLPLPLAQSVHGPMRTDRIWQQCHVFHCAHHYLFLSPSLHLNAAFPTLGSHFLLQLHPNNKKKSMCGNSSCVRLSDVEVVHVDGSSRQRKSSSDLSVWVGGDTAPAHQFWLIRCVPIRRAPCRWRAVIANATSSVCPGVPQSRSILFH